MHGVQARPDARGALHKNAPGLARVLGPEAPALLELVGDPPEGSQPLLLQMLYTLTGGWCQSAAPWILITFWAGIIFEPSPDA